MGQLHFTIVLIMAIPSIQIGFQLIGHGPMCMHVLIPKGYNMHGTYNVTGINENNIKFYVSNSSDQ